MTDTETLIRDLADRAELADLVARHSLWIDERQHDETDRLFTSDVSVHSVRGEARGIAELNALADRGHGDFAGTQHHKSNLVIDIDGDTATVRAHDLAVYLVDDDTAAFASAIHHYRARRTGDGWRFDRLDVTPVLRTGAVDRDL